MATSSTTGAPVRPGTAHGAAATTDAGAARWEMASAPLPSLTREPRPDAIRIGGSTPPVGIAPPALGAKTALRLARRQRLAAVRPPSWLGRADGPRRVSLASEDGALAFVLQVTGPGVLHVERIQRRPVGTLLVDCMRFRGGDAFQAWCASDPVRFDDPVLFGRVRRQGDELLAAAAQAG